MIRTIISLSLLGFVLPSVAFSDEKPAPLVFSAMGCGPYAPADLTAAQFYIAQENKGATSQFMIHLGDICSGKVSRAGKLTEKAYTDINTLFTKGNTIPSYIIPGDNEWNDRPDPDVGWALWSKHLLHLEKNFDVNWETKYQETHPENFAFIANEVLVIGINLTSGRIHDPEEWKRRLREDNDWIAAQFTKHKADARAAVVCCQANAASPRTSKKPIDVLFATFRKRFGKIAANFKKPVLFLHADGHKWMLDQPWKGAPNVTRLQVDRIEPRFPPVQIIVDASAEKPFRFERRLGLSEWAVPRGE